MPDDILMQMEKSTCYIGGEVNAIYKDKERIAVRFAVCFPDVYEIGFRRLAESER